MRFVDHVLLRTRVGLWFFKGFLSILYDVFFVIGFLRTRIKRFFR